jgi:hypothetical protein
MPAAGVVICYILCGSGREKREEVSSSSPSDSLTAARASESGVSGARFFECVFLINLNLSTYSTTKTNPQR